LTSLAILQALVIDYLPMLSCFTGNVACFVALPADFKGLLPALLSKLTERRRVQAAFRVLLC
jgi:hypothetical protein